MTLTQASRSTFSGFKGAARCRPRMDRLGDAAFYRHAALKPPCGVFRLARPRMQPVPPLDFTDIGCSLTDTSRSLLPAHEGELPMALAGALLAIARTVPGVSEEESIPNRTGPDPTIESLIVEANL